VYAFTTSVATGTKSAPLPIAVQPAVTIGDAGAASLTLSGYPSSITAGVVGSVSVTAKDRYGNMATSYTGTLRFSSSDAQAVLPGSYTFTSADRGAHTFSSTLKTAGSQTLTAVDTANATLTATVSTLVGPGVATRLEVSGLPDPYTAGVLASPVVKARDANGNVATEYRGTITFTAGANTDLPANYAFTAIDGGTHAFPNEVTMRATGMQTLSARDVATSAITGSQVVTVVPGGLYAVTMSSPGNPWIAGDAKDVSINAQDEYGNTLVGYAGTVHFSSTDARADLPADYAFVSTDHGTHDFPSGVTLRTVGQGPCGCQEVRVTETSDSAVTSARDVLVVAGALDGLSLSPASTTLAVGGSQTFTAEGFDINGNTLGDLTAATTFSISPEGTCSGSTCTATSAGAQTVLGADGAASGTAAVTVLHPMSAWTSLTAGTSISLVNDPPPGALTVQTTALGPLTVWTASSDAASTRTPVSPGAVYTARASVLAQQTARTVAMYELFYDGTGKMLNIVWGQQTVDSTSAWLDAFAVSAIAPPNATTLAFGVVFYDTAQDEVHEVAQPSVSTSAGSSPALHGPLHTSGKDILDATGSKVTLRGINRVGFENAPNLFPQDVEIAQAKGWGANIIRLPLAESFWLNTCGTDNPTNDPGYPAKVDSIVNSITSRGMVALLDLHKNVMSLCGKSQMQAMADARYAIDFWKQVANRYKDNPLVAFTLYNEPHDITDSVWLNGGSITWAGVTYEAAGMQQMYDAIRSQGADNLVFAAGNQYATRPPALTINGTDIVYAAHDYTCIALPCSAPNPFDAEVGLRAWDTFGATHPIMVTEFGWPNRLDGRYTRNAIAAAEARGWGWTAFAWDGGTEGTFSLLASAGVVYEPSPSGMPVLLGLTKNWLAA
jgi:hypothetical protein